MSRNKNQIKKRIHDQERNVSKVNEPALRSVISKDRRMPEKWSKRILVRLTCFPTALRELDIILDPQMNQMDVVMSNPNYGSKTKIKTN